MADGNLQAAADSLRAELAKLEGRSSKVRAALDGIEMLLADLPAEIPPRAVVAPGPEPEPEPQSEEPEPEPQSDEPEPAATAADVGERPVHTRDAIVVIMQDHPDQEWSPQTLTEELARRSWDPDSDNPVQAVRAATSRLAKDDRIVRVRKGAYRIAPPPPPKPAPEPPIVSFG